MSNSYVESQLGEREQILFIARQHWFVLVRAILNELLQIALILGVVTLLVWFVGPMFPPILPILPFLYILVVIPMVSLGRDFLLWSNRQFIVTSRRVLHVSGVLNKRVTDSSLEKVNDIRLEQSALGRMMGFGDIEILTGSDLGIDLYKDISEPIPFKAALLNAKEQLGEKPVIMESRPNIAAMITDLDALRQRGILTEEEFQQKKTELLSKI